MSVTIKLIHGTTENEVRHKKFNIYVAISLGNKWFTKKNISEYISWALENSKSKVVILVADTLHAINYEVRNNLTAEKARKKALLEGDKFSDIIKGIVNEFPAEQQKRLDIVRWDAMKRENSFMKQKKILSEEFKTNKTFRGSIMHILESHIIKENRNFSEEQKESLCIYIIEELPEIMNGFIYNGICYNLFPYPQDSLLWQFAKQLQEGSIYPDISKQLKIMNYNNCVILEVN